MNISIQPEDEALIRKRLESGAFKTVEEVVHHALEAQDADETWLEENRELIRKKIKRGLAQLEAGKGISAEEVWAKMQEQKAAWLKDHGCS